MRGYENLDEHDDDGFIEHDEEQMQEEDEGEEEEVQEVRKPTKEEIDFLNVRQQIKETMRKQMKKENASSTGNSQERKKHNYGSFFGPSQPVIAQRVIQESKSLLENQHLAARVLNPRHSLQSKKSPALAKATPRPGVRERPLKVVSMEKQKAQILKDTRDSSFLLSEDAELPVPTKVLPSRTGSVPNSDARSAQLSSKRPKSVSSTSRPVLNGREQRPPVSVGHRMQSKPGQLKLTSGSRPDSTSVNHKKQLGSSTGNGPGCSLGTKGFPSRTSIQMKPITSHKTSHRFQIADVLISRIEMFLYWLGKGLHLMCGKQCYLGHIHLCLVCKNNYLSRSHLRLVFREHRKQPVSSSTAPKVKTPKQLPSRPPPPKDRRRKRSMSPDPNDVRLMVRNMFNYNPNKYGSDEDDSSMEVSFNDIMREERHISRIAHKEDERERILIEKEEKEERMRKKRKLSSQRR